MSLRFAGRLQPMRKNRQEISSRQGGCLAPHSLRSSNLRSPIILVAPLLLRHGCMFYDAWMQGWPSIRCSLHSVTEEVRRRSGGGRGNKFSIFVADFENLKFGNTVQ